MVEATNRSQLSQFGFDVFEMHTCRYWKAKAQE
jgi:hypothetical protein